jgi:hypothetical protein
LELIELYLKVNSAIIQENPNQNPLFVQVTQCLDALKKTLENVQVKPTFKHAWFPGTGTVSFWVFFNKFNLETEKKSEATNVKKFFIRYEAPQIPKSEQNLRNLQIL